MNIDDILRAIFLNVIFNRLIYFLNFYNTFSISLFCFFFQMIVGSMPCPLYLKEKRIVNEELSEKYDNVNSDLYKYLSEHTGQNITSVLDVESIYNILEIQVRKDLQTLFVNNCAFFVNCISPVICGII